MGKEVVGLKTLYCAELHVCRCHFSVYFDPEEWFWAGECDQEGKPDGWVWLSPVFADRYSARNWAYCRLRECFLRKIPSGVFALLPPFYSSFVVTEITVESQLAQRMIGRNPHVVGYFDFRIRYDAQFMLRFQGRPWPDVFEPPMPKNLSQPFLLDSFFDNTGGMGKGYGRLGPSQPVFKLRDDADRSEIQDLVSELTDAAVQRREWTIPDGAVVDNNTVQFPYVQLNETERLVSFLFRDDPHYFSVGFDRETREWDSDHVLLDLPGKEQPRVDQSTLDHKLAVTYVCALLLHDFWVTEYRERNKILNPRRIQLTSGVLPWAKRSEDGRVLVYRPHVHYFDSPDNDAGGRKGGFKRFLAFRSAHIRDLMGKKKATLRALFLASQYGLSVPSGCTFVRPYVRNGDCSEMQSALEHRREYRSQSALRALCNAQIFQDSRCHIQWEKFESEVKEKMTALGFTIIAPTWTRKGDGGIDVIAVKKVKTHEVVFCVQCKCWSPKRVVGLGVLRDFDAAIERFKASYDLANKEIRGMIITTSRFSDGPDFRSEIERRGIILVDGNALASAQFGDQIGAR